MKKVSQEICIVYWDSEIPEAVVVSNGAHTFYGLKKLNREAVANLLGAEVKVEYEKAKS